MSIPSSSKVIGMIGGMSWESTAEYYRLVNVLVRERLGGLHSARCVLVSVDFADVERLQARDRWDEAAHLLGRAAQQLETAGADLILLCTNTMHIVADQIQASVNIPLLHIADISARAVTAEGLSTVGLLGTAFTMERPFYRERLESHGLRTLVPDTDDRSEIHRIIYEELCVGQFREQSRQRFREIIQRLAERGAQGVILGCTEIEILITTADSPVPVFPTTRLHVAAACDELGDEAKARRFGGC